MKTNWKTERVKVHPVRKMLLEDGQASFNSMWNAPILTMRLPCSMETNINALLPNRILFKLWGYANSLQG